MKIRMHNVYCEDTIYTVVRMNKAEYRALREYMHTKDGEDVWFPYGVSLVKHGYGWYYVAPTRPKRALEKMLFAEKVLRRFMQLEEEKVEEEIKRLMPAAIADSDEGTITEVNMHIVAFSNAHGLGEFAYAGNNLPRDTQVRPADPHRLQKLANKFNNRRQA